MNTTKKARLSGLIKSDKLWQRNYYERVLRNKTEILEYYYYIRNNPKNWSKDPENKLLRISQERWGKRKEVSKITK